MVIDYDEFRRTAWEERVAIFSALTPDEKAELFRSQLSEWLRRHRGELKPPQIELLEEMLALVVPELYVRPAPDPLMARLKDIEHRAAELLSCEQRVDALTMQWGMT